LVSELGSKIRFTFLFLVIILSFSVSVLSSLFFVFVLCTKLKKKKKRVILKHQVKKEKKRKEKVILKHQVEKKNIYILCLPGAKHQTKKDRRSRLSCCGLCNNNLNAWT
jgi:uncharacterized ion transporter superfamily protein YfcC